MIEFKCLISHQNKILFKNKKEKESMKKQNKNSIEKTVL